MTVIARPSPERTKIDANLIVTEQFANVFQAYLECSAEVQAGIRDMVQVMKSGDVTADEYDAALATIAEALFPSKCNGELGFDLEECPDHSPDEVKKILSSMDQEEATFSERLEILLEAKGMTQSELATAIGVGQPAVSMMLARKCRPQRRTIEKIAQALEVAAEELWPGIKEE